MPSSSVQDEARHSKGSGSVVVKVDRVTSDLGPENLRSWIRCEDVNYTIQNKKKSFHILKDVSCVFPPGRLVALMGPSGAGKTTFGSSVLRLSGVGKTTGSLLLNNKPSTKNLMKRYSKLVPQEDILEPVLTPRETLRYAAELALDATKEERYQRAEELIEMLSLQDCADVVVGGTNLKGLSGGQRKRVSIALEMIQDPSILILDEPTSGLDSKVAEDVVDIIKVLARGGRTVICTIHQPSFQVFSKFDWLVMLSKGEVAYNGRVDTVTDFLAEIGTPVPEYVNPADHFMFVLSEHVPMAGCDTFGEAFKASSFYNIAVEDAKQVEAEEKAYLSSNDIQSNIKVRKSGFQTSAIWQFHVLLRRIAAVTLKDKAQFRVRVAQLTFVGLIIGTIFLRLPNTQGRVQDRVSVLFLLMLFLGMSSIMSTAMVVTGERALVKREVNNNFYHNLSYYVARVIVLVSLQTAYAMGFCAVTYFMIGFNPAAARFFKFLFIFVLISLFAGSAGYAAGLSFPNMQALSAVLPMVIMPLTLFAGLFIPLANIPNYWIWLAYLSPFQYALEALVLNEFGGATIEACSQADLASSGSCPYGACNSANSSDPLPCSGLVVIENFGYAENHFWRDIGIIIAIIVVILAFGMIQLKRLVSQKT